jgi:hypothetical protein
MKKNQPHLNPTDICKRLEKSPKNTRKASAETVRRQIGPQLG